MRTVSSGYKNWEFLYQLRSFVCQGRPRTTELVIRRLNCVYAVFTMFSSFNLNLKYHMLTLLFNWCNLSPLGDCLQEQECSSVK
jgi:hypothetical protein